MIEQAREEEGRIRMEVLYEEIPVAVQHCLYFDDVAGYQRCVDASMSIRSTQQEGGNKETT